jgi:hypothetical protein
MPKSYLFPPVATPSLLIALVADTDFSADMLGAIVELAGFELNLVAVDGFGSCNVTGPGTYAGLMSGSVAAGQALAITVNAADFSVAGSGSGAGVAAWELKSADFIAVVGGRYQVDCSAGPVAMALPEGMAAMDGIEVQDVALSWGTNDFTIVRAEAGLGDTINGLASDYTANVAGGKLDIVAFSAPYGVSIK